MSLSWSGRADGNCKTRSMHLLIFFFAFAHFARLDNFLVYAVVYAAYFFPWRLLRDSSVESAKGVADLRG
jgi:hypothetical protein